MRTLPIAVPLLALALPLGAALAGATAVEPPGDTPAACPAVQRAAPLELSEPRPQPPAADGRRVDYRHTLRGTPAGWPVRDHWCLWIEPGAAAAGTAAAEQEEQWRRAVLRGLQPWRDLLDVTVVPNADQAQVRLWRRRPPLQRLANGRTRASNGRAILALLQVDRGGGWQAEPRIEVLISPGRPPLAMQATALHELGHAFGLWGHSDQPGDAMHALPGAKPLLELSARDRATLLWLQQQSDRLRLPATPAESPAAEQAPRTAPRAN